MTGPLLRRWRRNRPPSEAVRPLEPGERVTQWATTDDGDTVVATPAGLWLTRDSERVRLSWHEIHKATWTAGVLEVTPAAEVSPGVMADLPPVRLRLAEPRALPPEVRTRVTRSVAFSVHHRLPGGGVRVVGRRVPGRDGVHWVLRYDPGTDLDDPLVRATAEEHLARTRAAAGGADLTD